MRRVYDESKTMAAKLGKIEEALSLQKDITEQMFAKSENDNMKLYDAQ